MSSLSSSETMCHFNECAQPPCQCLPFKTSEKRDTHVRYVRPVPRTPRSEPSELQNLHRNSASGLPQKNSEREHIGMAVMALSNASSITLQTSGVNVSECVVVKGRLFSIQFDCRFYMCTF